MNCVSYEFVFDIEDGCGVLNELFLEVVSGNE